MKLVLNETQVFEVNKKPFLSGDPISFSLAVESAEDIPSEITGPVVLKDTITWPKSGPVVEGEDPTDGVEAQDFVLFETTAESWLRHYVSGNTLYFTNTPEPEPAPEPTPEEIEAEKQRQLEETKSYMIAQSKTELELYLATHPLQWVDGNYYSVTQDKQALLTSQISLYKVAMEAGQPYELKWNTTGDVCTVWTIENLSALALSIGAYVQPLVTHQQTLEVAVRNATSMEELDAINIEYDSVHNPVEEDTESGEE